LVNHKNAWGKTPLEIADDGFYNIICKGLEIKKISNGCDKIV
jgi:hypothetical protein